MNETDNEKRLGAAEVALYELERARTLRDRELGQQVDDLKRRLAEQVEAEFGERLKAARQAVADAQAPVDAERIASASSRAVYPIGTILYQWERPAGWFTRPYERIGKAGRVEVFTVESHFPANRQWRKPKPGDVVIRLLKKNGSPATLACKFDDWRTGIWLPEGETPKE